MPEVTLVVGRSLRIDGLALVKGVPQPISEEQAEVFRDNPRLKIDEDGKGGGALKPQTPEELTDAIKNATDRLDADDESNWDQRGLPKKDKLKNVLGYSVSNSDIVKAVGRPIVNEPEQVKKTLKVADKEPKADTPPVKPAYKAPVKPEKVKPVGKGKITIKKAVPGGEPLDTGAAAANSGSAGGDNDPTTEGALEP